MLDVSLRNVRIQPGLSWLRNAMSLVAALGIASHAVAANLTLDENVVVKFGPGTGLTVRDGLIANKHSIFTSIKDDAVIGQTGSTAQIPAAADWRGVKVESSASPAAVNLNTLGIKYAGGNSGAALDLRKLAYSFDALFVTNSTKGIRITNGSASTFTNLSLVANETGMEADGNSAVVISTSEIKSNTVFGINNKTPITIIQATGNWWNDATGPTDAVGNPNGRGDKVSTGVNYGSYALNVPLIDCSVKVTDGRYSITSTNIALSLACRNAIEYRLSEGGNFTTGNFSPMSSSTTFTLSSALGQKTVYAQFRASSGNTVVVQLPQAITLNQNQLLVSLTSPLPGVEITGPVTVTATASDPAGIARVDFRVDEVLLASDTTSPYSFNWTLTGVPDGNHVIKAVAVNTNGDTVSDSRTVTVRLSINDVTGPTIGEIKYAGTVLAPNTTLTQNGNLTVAVSDAGGVRSVEVKLDNQIMTGGSLGGGLYSVNLNLNAVANGARTITITAFDNFNNQTTKQLAISVNLPAPNTPVISAPLANTIVRAPALSVVGTAQAGSQVQLFLNGSAAASLINVGTNGSYAGTITLQTEGINNITATAVNTRGTSAPTAAVPVTYTIGPPSVAFASPAAGVTLQDPVAFQATVSDALGISNVAFYIDGTLVATKISAPYTYLWDAPNAVEGPHTLRLVATNFAGKTAEAIRSVSSRPTPPPPPPPPYLGEVTSITPALSFGDQSVTITGRAKDRATGVSTANVNLRVVLTVAGFQRKINVAADATGAFTYTFAPQPADAGSYTVSVIHPDDTSALSTMGSFVINRLTVSPTRFSVSAARGFEQVFSISVATSAGTGASNVRVEATPSDQPSGSLPAGISLRNSSALNLGSAQSGTLMIGLTGASNAAETGTIVLNVFANESGTAKRAKVTVDYRLSNPTPALFAIPTLIDTGAAQGTQSNETIVLENRGLVAATGVQVQLLDLTNNPAPAWISFATAPHLGTIGAGLKQSVQIAVSPPATVTDGTYTFKMRVISDNATGGEIPVSVRVTQAGFGGMQFKLADIYTNTNDRAGNPILGLAGATIRIQSETVLSVTRTATSDSRGEALLSNVPTGRYTYRVSAPNHADASGRLLIKPGVTGQLDAFLDYTLVTVEFTVTETTIIDRYEVKLQATYQTEVPAPVVVMEPGAINIPDLQVGEEYTGEISLTNYGLVRADDVAFTPPTGDGYFRIEFLGQVPTELAAKERVTIPYKITALQALPGSAVGQSSSIPLRVMMEMQKRSSQEKSPQMARLLSSGSGASCYSYSSKAEVTVKYTCANGSIRSTGASSSFAKTYGTCGGGSSPSQSVGVGAGNAGGFGGYVGAPVSTPAQSLSPAKCVPGCESGTCCAGPDGGSGGPPPPPPAAPGPMRGQPPSPPSPPGPGPECDS